MQKILSIDTAQNQVRTISFNGNTNDPYVIFHPDPDALSDTRLKPLYDEWLETLAAPDDAEAFEDFLAWLGDEKGYVNLVVADAMIDF